MHGMLGCVVWYVRMADAGANSGDAW